jgi:hypothetical protein
MHACMYTRRHSIRYTVHAAEEVYKHVFRSNAIYMCDRLRVMQLLSTVCCVFTADLLPLINRQSVGQER